MPHSHQQPASEPKAQPYTPVFRAKKYIEKAKGLDGVYRSYNIGEPVPGAENWPDPMKWVVQGWIERIDGLPHDPALHGEYVPPHAVTEEEAKAALEKKLKRLDGEYVMTSNPWGKPSEEERRQIAAKTAGREFPESQLPYQTEPVNQATSMTLQELRKLDRDVLVKMAEKENLTVNKKQSKTDIINALLRPSLHEPAALATK